MDTTKKGGLSARAFFAAGHASISDAMRGAGVAYTTVLRARDAGSTISADTARALEAWSRGLPTAVDPGVWISAAVTLGVSAAGSTEAA